MKQLKVDKNLVATIAKAVEEAYQKEKPTGWVQAKAIGYLCPKDGTIVKDSDEHCLGKCSYFRGIGIGYISCYIPEQLKVDGRTFFGKPRKGKIGIE